MKPCTPAGAAAGARLVDKVVTNDYLESSAALRDLLGGDRCEQIRGLLADAEIVATSRCTLAEVGRVFARLRTLEAIHLATIERLAGAIERLVVLSTDDRVRTNAKALGFPLAPG